MHPGIDYSDIVFASFGLSLLIAELVMVKYGPSFFRWLLMKLYSIFISNKRLEH